jgi:glucose uptake protein
MPKSNIYTCAIVFNVVFSLMKEFLYFLIIFLIVEERKMSILIALVPALAWGSVGIVTTKAGGTAAQGIMGMTIGALILGFGTLFAFVIPNAGVDYAFNSRIWLVGFLSGLVWAIGQVGQLIGFKKLGVSIGNPLSTSGQIVGNALMAAAVLGEWHTGRMWFFGILSIALVTIGALFTTVRDTNAPKDLNPERDFKGGVTAVIVSTLGFMAYFVIPNLLNKWGYISDAMHNQNNGLDYMTAIVAPQSLGQILGAILIVIFFFKETGDMFKSGTWRQVITGLVWALGNVFMFISTGNPDVGQATATTLSQTGIIVGTFGAIFILKEKKTKRQMGFIIVGAIMVVIGAILISKLAEL